MAPRSGSSWLTTVAAPELEITDLDTCLDTGAVAASLREADWNALYLWSDKAVKAGIISMPIIYDVRRTKTQHFVGFDYEPGKPGETPKTMQVRTESFVSGPGRRTIPTRSYLR